ncbi:hypothetical protein U9M48_011020 [Paspalum notatum var. saurae]|uniref:Uncharacterized protein n=1 Tax=Paspalum notatum var. saurae TaxID=547442 RepID=A0AAQ3SUV4_PASNO
MRDCWLAASEPRACAMRPRVTSSAFKAQPRTAADQASLAVGYSGCPVQFPAPESTFQLQTQAVSNKSSRAVEGWIRIPPSPLLMRAKLQPNAPTSSYCAGIQLFFSHTSVGTRQCKFGLFA